MNSFQKSQLLAQYHLAVSPGIRFHLHRRVVHSKQAVLINTVYRMEHNGHTREIIGRIINNCGFSGTLLSAL